MATVKEVSDQTNMPRCPICLERYCNPRKLPNCLHCFCEACITTYIVRSLGHSETEIACPLCKIEISVPKVENEVTKWVQSFALDEDLISKRNDDVVNQRNCDSCEAFGIKTKATKICLSCFELFCFPCSMGRHSDKLYRNHKVKDLEKGGESDIKETSLEEFQTLKEYSFCLIHADKPIEYYCRKDNCLCCAKCLVADHRHCDDVTDLHNCESEEVRNALKVVLNSMGKLSLYAKNAITITKKSAEDIKMQAENIRKSLQEVRTKLNNLLDTLDDITDDQTKPIIKKEILCKEQTIEKLNETVDGLNACSLSVENTLEYGHASHCYGILQTAENLCLRYKADIFDTCETSENVRLVLQPEAILQNLLDVGPNDANSLAKVIERRNNAHVPPIKEFDLMKNYSVSKAADKRVVENYSSKSSPTYSNLAFRANDCAVLNDTHLNYCCFTNKIYDAINSYKIKARACSCFKDGTIALTVPGENKIYILNADSEPKKVREITTESAPVAIHCLENGDVAVSWKEPVAFGIISCQEMPNVKIHFCKDKADRELKSFDYIAVDEVRKHVIQPCTKDDAVYCFDYEGNPKFKYTNTMLKDPRGVALDRDGNIYACSYSERVIHIFSPTGRNIRIIKEGCPARPLAIAFKKNGEEFAVTNGTSDYRLVTFFKLQKQ